MDTELANKQTAVRFFKAALRKCMEECLNRQREEHETGCFLQSTIGICHSLGITDATLVRIKRRVMNNG